MFTRKRWGNWLPFAMVATVIVALVATLGISLPAEAAPPTAILDITKSVDHSAVGLGGSFTYTIAVDCSTDNCPNAKVVDVLPPEFDALTLDPIVSVTGGTSTYAWSGPNSRTLTVTFTKPIPLQTGVVGIPAGTGYSVVVHMSVPSNLAASWPSNGIAVPNTAVVSADTADTKQSSANVTVTIPVTVDASVTKTWLPASTQFRVGEQSAITLGARNLSNTFADSLTLTEPSNPAAVNNPFNTVTFSGFGAFNSGNFPGGADQVQIDAYVAGAWVVGTPASSPALPSGVDPTTVVGIRAIFSSTTGATIAASGAAGSIQILAIQRAAVRGTGTSLVSGAVVSNTASGTVTVPGQSAVTKTASATYTITGLNTQVSATKTFTPSRIPAGTSSLAKVTATNTSNGVLTSMSITEPGSGSFFTNKVVFDHFDSSIDTWPSGATSATVTWQVNTGSVPAPTTFVNGDALPTTPTLTVGQWITGFVVTYTGDIATSASVLLPFWVAVSADAVPVSPGIQTFTNVARIDGSNDAGNATPVSPSAGLQVLYPALPITFIKTVTPSIAVPAGGRSTVQLLATTSSDSGFVAPHTITIEDKWDGTALNYWNAFNAMSIAPTQVSLGSTLTVSYTTDGTNWTQFAVVDATLLAKSYTAALPSPTSDIVGVRFVFNNAVGYAQGSAIGAALSFQARATLRDLSGPTATAGSDVTYTNGSLVDVEGTVTQDGIPQTVSATQTASDTAIVRAPNGSGDMRLSKAWQAVSGSTSVSAQSGQQRTARLLWGSEVDGYATAQVSDPSNPTLPVAQTVFQNFDLISIGAITTATDPLIEFDKVIGLELYNGSTWTQVGSCTVATPCNGSFPGYTLTGPQVTSTVGIRITFAEYAAGRVSNPLAPPVGSGVASSTNDRRIDLVFQLRNQLRDSSATPTNPWITGDRIYNAVDPGSVDNTTGETLTPISGSPVTATAHDPILVINSLPQLSLTKVSSKSSVSIPIPADVTPPTYPTNSFTMVGTNTSFAKAWYLRITDPMPCTSLAVSTCVHNSAGASKGYNVNPYTGATYDATTNPFERFTLTKITLTVSGGSGISLPLSTVTLWNFDGTTQTVAGNSATLTNAATLANVVGVSVLFASTSTSNGGTIASGATGTVKLDTILRQFLRSDGTTLVTPTTVTNDSFAQIYDDVLTDTDRYQTKSASINLLSSTLAVTASKSFTPNTILEANRASDITVSLGATSGTAAQSTASSKQVVIEDSTAGFWNTFTLRSIGTVVLPTGANRVRVDAQVDGSSTWTLGTAAASAALPAGVTAAHVTGIRFTFTNSTGAIFSTAAPAPQWTSSAALVVRVRDNYLDSGLPVAFPSSVSNTVLTSSSADTFTTVTNSATTSMTLDAGTFKVDVEKRPSTTTSPAGEFVDFSLIFTNTGTGFLNNPVVVDSLPIDGALPAGGPLLFDPTSVPTYTDSVGGILPTTGVTVSYNDITRKVTFTWPAGARLAPGEKYTIVLSLQLAPGLAAAYGAATNSFAVSSDRVLTACTNSSGNMQGVTWSTDHKSCTTSNSITTFAASAISSFKGVKGNVDGSGNSTMGALNVTDPSIPCVADSQGFYRNPCAAGTVIGGTDLWKLQFTNGGNIPATSATIVDVLPKAGDTFLRTAASRGSTYKPVFAGAVTMLSGAPTGTAFTWQVTTSSNPCPTYETNSTCSTATWVNGATFSSANYGTVTAIRVIFDFTAVSGGTLAPGASLAITYKSVNTPSTTGSDGRVKADASVTTSQAWNTFGVYATFGSGFSDRRVEPVRAGVRLVTGPILVTKAIAGVTAAYAPTSFTVTVTCTVAGVAVVLPSAGVLTLAATSTVPYTGRIDGIPVGADCRVVETGASGASSVAYSPLASVGPAAAGVTISTAAASTDAVPSGQQTTVTNTYGESSLTVSKTVTTDSTVGTFGPFAFSVTCSVNNGTTILSVPLAGGLTTETFSLSDGGSHLIDHLPVTAVCTVRETDSNHASSITVSKDSGAATSIIENQAVAVTVSAGSAHTAAFTNNYQGGQIAVTKTLAGAGAGSYGSGPFTVAVACTYYSQSLLDTTISILGGETKTLTPIFPVGTSCSVNETDAGGATSASGLATVSIPAPTGVQVTGLVTVNVTNTFSVGSVQVNKSVIGAGASAYGAGPFTAQVTCTWVKGVDTLTIPLPNSGIVTLTSANSYSATVTGLIAGASCTAAETASGGATSTDTGTMTPSTISAGGTGTIALTNHFDTGSLIINKVRTGGAAVDRFGNGPFTVTIACTFDKDGTATPIDLGANVTQSLSLLGGYSAQIDGILVGASCTVTETDSGLAVSSSTTPTDGAVTIVDSSQPVQATVVVTNDFSIGGLHLEKTPSVAIVEGDTAFDYTFVVTNPGTVAASGVTLTDPLDATLKATAVDSPGWTDCSVAGANVDGYGGTLTCVLDTDLAAGGTAPTITLSVTVLSTIAQDSIDNTATVTSTNPIVDGDTASASVPVKWLAVSADSQCVMDAPWLNYTVDAHNLDVAGKVMHVSWADKSGTFVHQDDVTIAADGTITGSLLWPGAAVRSDGAGIAWPGYRPALPGETPTWENLVLDPTTYGYGLRDNPLITISINPQTTITVAYPASTPSCELVRDPQLAFTKTASVGVGAGTGVFDYTMSLGNTGLGAVDTVTLVDPLPHSLKVLGTSWATAAAGAPNWTSCVVTDRLPSGFGGTLTCLLDRPLGYNEVAPDVYLRAQVDKSVGGAFITNTAEVTAVDSKLGGLPTLALQSSAIVPTAAFLAFTGVSVAVSLWGALAAMLIGLGLLLWRRKSGRHATGNTSIE